MPTPPKSDWGMDAKRIGVHRCGRKTMLPTSFIQTEGCLPLLTFGNEPSNANHAGWISGVNASIRAARPAAL
jgi:hypothetical protein